MTLLVVVINGLLDINFCLFMPRKLYYEKRLLKFLSEAFGGETGIRTPGTSRYNGFQDRRNRPLCHLSSPCKTLVCFVWDCKGRYFFLFCNFYLLKTTRFLFFSNEWKIIVMLFVINFFWNNTHRVLIIVI